MTIDPGGRTGYALGETESGIVTEAIPVLHKFKRLTTGVFLIDRDLVRLSQRQHMFFRWLKQMYRGNKIERVFYERAIMGPVPNFETDMQLFGYANTIGLAAEEVGIISQSVPASTWRSAFGVPTSAPRAVPKNLKKTVLKRATIDRCRALGAEVVDNNEADAIGLFHVAAWGLAEVKKRRSTQLNMFDSVSM